VNAPLLSLPGKLVVAQVLHGERLQQLSLVDFAEILFARLQVGQRADIGSQVRHRELHRIDYVGVRLLRDNLELWSFFVRIWVWYKGIKVFLHSSSVLLKCFEAYVALHRD